jgi:hypothetical protein
MKSEEEIRERIDRLEEWARKWRRQYDMSCQPPAGTTDYDALGNSDECWHWASCLRWVLEK